MKKLALAMGTLLSMNAYAGTTIECQVDKVAEKSTWQYDASLELDEGKFPEQIKISIARSLSNGEEEIYVVDQAATLKKSTKTYAYYEYTQAAYGLRFLVSLRDLGESAELSVYHRLSEAGALQSATADCKMN